MISHSIGLKRYCSEPVENIENYDKAVADKEQMWECHHRAEILPCGVFTPKQLQKHGLYWNRPARELIFLPHGEHRRLHNLNLSQEVRRKKSMSITNNPLLSRPVEMTRLSDGFTKVFPSQSEAARWLRENGYHKAACRNIRSCCSGKYRFAYGAKWRHL